MNPYNTFCEPAKTIATFFYFSSGFEKPIQNFSFVLDATSFLSEEIWKSTEILQSKGPFPSGWPFKIQYKAALNLLLSVFCSLTRGSGIKYC